MNNLRLGDKGNLESTKVKKNLTLACYYIAIKLKPLCWNLERRRMSLL